MKRDRPCLSLGLILASRRSVCAGVCNVLKIQKYNMSGDLRMKMGEVPEITATEG
jgi:hypothetical protein